MRRTNIYLPEPQHKALDKEAKRLGRTKSEVIRNLIDEALLQRDFDTKWMTEEGLIPRKGESFQDLAKRNKSKK